MRSRRISSSRQSRLWEHSANFIRILDGCVDRKFSEEVGLNLFEF